MGKPQRRFGKEFAVEAVRLVEVSGRTQKEIARDLGVGLSTLRRYAVRLKKISLDKRLECRVVPHPHTGWIDHPLHLQLGRRSVIDIVADVLLVGENLVDGAARPRSAEIRADAFRIQNRGDLAFGPPLHDKHAVQATRDLHFLRGPRPQHDSVRLKTLLLAPIEDRFRLAGGATHIQLGRPDGSQDVSTGIAPRRPWRKVPGYIRPPSHASCS
jgi:hypothetical protein